MPKTSIIVSGLMLMAVVAVLAFVGISAMVHIQASARDTKRFADINAIATTLEVHYDNQLSQYVPLAASQFQNGTLPQDPLKGPSCKKDANPSTPPTPCHYCIGPYTSNCQVVGPGEVAAAASWEICAALEQGRTYCRFSSR